MIRNSDYNFGGKLSSRPPKEYIRVGTYVKPNGNRALTAVEINPLYPSGSGDASPLYRRIKRTTFTLNEVANV